jgi:hypothetical protein
MAEQREAARQRFNGQRDAVDLGRPGFGHDGDTHSEVGSASSAQEARACI